MVNKHNPGQPQWVHSLSQVSSRLVKQDRPFFSATHEEISEGLTTDIYFVAAQDILKHLVLERTSVAVDIFPSRKGVFCGIPECLNLLSTSKVEIWSLGEGETFNEKEVVVQIRGPYAEFGVYETPLLGILAHSSGWATAARECKEAAGGKKVICFGARHVHPAVAPVMERAAFVGGMDGAACILGAFLAGHEPGGTIPHAAILIIGDTVVAAQTFQKVIPERVPRIILVDTFKDEAEESLRVAESLTSQLDGIRLDTPSERGGVSAALAKEVRSRLDIAGYSNVSIVVSGGMDPDRISSLREIVDIFGVGSYISARSPIDMTMDIKEIEGKPIAKRGRIPGAERNPRLKKRR